jgi:hypothetical protein
MHARVSQVIPLGDASFSPRPRRTPSSSGGMIIGAEAGRITSRFFGSMPKYGRLMAFPKND